MFACFLFLSDSIHRGIKETRFVLWTLSALYSVGHLGHEIFSPNMIRSQICVCNVSKEALDHTCQLLNYYPFDLLSMCYSCTWHSLNNKKWTQWEDDRGLCSCGVCVVPCGFVRVMRPLTNTATFPFQRRNGTRNFSSDVSLSVRRDNTLDAGVETPSHSIVVVTTLCHARSPPAFSGR